MKAKPGWKGLLAMGLSEGIMSFSDKRVRCSQYLSENTSTVPLMGYLTVSPHDRLHGDGVGELSCCLQKEIRSNFSNMKRLVSCHSALPTFYSARLTFVIHAFIEEFKYSLTSPLNISLQLLIKSIVKEHKDNLMKIERNDSMYHRADKTEAYITLCAAFGLLV